jgi:hypothetical protein
MKHAPAKSSAASSTIIGVINSAQAGAAQSNDPLLFRHEYGGSALVAALQI